MTVWSSLGLGLVTSFLWLALIEAVKKGNRELRRHRPVRRLWNLQEESQLTIVISDAGLSDKSEYTGLVYPSETRAAGEIETFLIRTYPKLTVQLHLSSNVSNELLSKDLVVIGGPIYNSIAKDLLTRSPSLANFDGYRLLLSNGNWSQEATIDSNGEVTTDVGLVYITKNPWNPQKRIFLFAGSRAFGTLAASRIMTVIDTIPTGRTLKKTKLRRALKKSNFPVAFAVVADVRNQDVLNVRIDQTSITIPSNY